MVVGAALDVLRLLQLHLRRHLVGAADVAVLLLLLDLRLLPAAEGTPSSWARQGNGILPANVTLLKSSFFCLVSPLGVEVAASGCSDDRGRPDHHLGFCNLEQILSRLLR